VIVAAISAPTPSVRWSSWMMTHLPVFFALADRLAVERLQAAQVDDFDLDALLGDDLGGLERVVQRQPVRVRGHVRALAADRGGTELDRVVPRG
jgi:hypothetical protein